MYMGESLRRMSHNNRALLQESNTSFHTGKFNQCLMQTEHLAFAQRDIAEWISQNNSLACRYKQAQNITDGKTHTVEKEFNGLLLKLKTLPPFLNESLLTEVSVLYNCMYITITNDWKQRSGASSLEVPLKDCLRRVVRVVTRQYDDVDDLHQFEVIQFAVNTLITHWKEKRGTVWQELKQILSTVISLWCIYSIQRENVVEAEMILEQFTDMWSRSKNTGQEESPCGLAVMLGQGIPQLSREEHRDIQQLLLAACYLQQQRLTDCRTASKPVTSSKWKPYGLYFEALAHSMEDSDEEVMRILQQLKWSELENVDSALRARIHNLVGCCLAKLSKTYTAIQQYKEALETDFTFLLPLYNISLQYRRLNVEDAELESLNLLSTALENTMDSKKSEVGCLEDMVKLTVLSATDRPHHLTLPQIQYCLANRCLQLSRYGAAYQWYMDLVALITESGIIQGAIDLIILPSVTQIFAEAAHTALRSGHPEDCIILCERVIDTCTATPTLQSYSPDLSTTVTERQTKERKRKRVESVLPEDQVRDQDPTMRCRIYKSDAHLHLGQLPEAFNSLKCALEILEKRLVRSQVKQGTCDNMNTQPEPPGKRPRLGSDSSDMQRSGTTENSCPDLFADMYFKLGHISSLQNKHKQSLHYYRLTLLLNKNDRRAVYHCTEELLSQNRPQEAVTMWLNFRHINPRMDAFQIGTELKRKQSNVKSMVDGKKDEDRPSQREVSLMDVRALESLLHHQQHRVWTVC